LDMGRIYIPLEDMERFGYSEGELKAGAVSDGFRRLMAFEVDRARKLFHQGVKLVAMVDAELRLDLKLFTMGGLSVLDAIERQGYDVLSRRPRVSRARKLRLMGTAFVQLGVQRLVGGRGRG
ncbi:MAG: squalene/phytoene synthase family protein, partial [Dehalococcoidia bacterium]